MQLPVVSHDWLWSMSGTQYWNSTGDSKTKLWTNHWRIRQYATLRISIWASSPRNGSSEGRPVVTHIWSTCLTCWSSAQSPPVTSIFNALPWSTFGCACRLIEYSIPIAAPWKRQCAGWRWKCLSRCRWSCSCYLHLLCYNNCWSRQSSWTCRIQRRLWLQGWGLDQSKNRHCFGIRSKRRSAQCHVGE